LLTFEDVDWNNIWQPRPPPDDGTPTSTQVYDAPAPLRKPYKARDNLQVNLADEVGLINLLDKQPGKLPRNRFPKNQDSIDW
jgi:hypothetical protein